MRARSAGASSSCSGSGAQMEMNGAVSVHLRYRPAKFAFDALDRGGGRRRARREYAQPVPQIAAQLGGPVGDRNQHRGCCTEHRDSFAVDQTVDGTRLDLSQADVRRASRGTDPRVGPAVRVEHRQRPEEPVGRRHRHVRHRADAVHPGIAVRDHHTLGARSGAAGVVD
jgi:hypothetical protein